MPVDFLDIEATEPDYYKTLRQVLETPLDLLMMDLTFSAEVQQFGRTEVIQYILTVLYTLYMTSIIIVFNTSFILLLTVPDYLYLLAGGGSDPQRAQRGGH